MRLLVTIRNNRGLHFALNVFEKDLTNMVELIGGNCSFNSYSCTSMRISLILPDLHGFQPAIKGFRGKRGRCFASEATNGKSTYSARIHNIEKNKAHKAKILERHEMELNLQYAIVSCAKR